MMISMTEGQPVIDAHDLGPLLGLEPAQVPVKMRSGEITSRFETGAQEDAGRFRLTFYHNGTRLRLTCAQDGSVLSTSRAPVGK
ncbi:DUF6522 family protein [Sulfitobacter sp. F26204]|uniref:DUF6522 family protein n=1 Tax=Sulfitobacter sp. F26204 TaxID=2996014 RepID=UPI00225E3457|nr:DUF6522 family protein [Sulfitobacter sp. F26204]MCX7560184.1 DUF6522 family protein [Sulfitobacter sp. F26204]